MIFVAVETNFLLGLAKGEFAAEHRDALLDHAQAGRVTLCLPDIAIFEALHAAQGENARRIKMKEELDALISKHKSLPNKEQLLAAVEVLSKSSDTLRIQLETAIETVLSLPHVALPVRLAPGQFPKKVTFSGPADELVFRSVLEKFKAVEPDDSFIFFTMDTSGGKPRGFSQAAREVSMKLVTRLEDLLGFIESALS